LKNEFTAGDGGAGSTQGNRMVCAKALNWKTICVSKEIKSKGE
jgi:hypothetical protein